MYKDFQADQKQKASTPLENVDINFVFQFKI